MRAAAKALKALETRLAFGVDLAAVERLALVLIAEEFVGGIQLGKARRRLRIVLVGVGMQLLGEPPVGALDVARTRLAIEAQGPHRDHASPTDSASVFGPAPPAHGSLQCGIKPPSRNATAEIGAAAYGDDSAGQTA